MGELSEYVCKILWVEDPEFWSKSQRHPWPTLEYPNSFIRNTPVQLYTWPPAIIWCSPHIDLFNISWPLCSSILSCLWHWWSFCLRCLFFILGFVWWTFYFTFKILFQGHLLWRDFIAFVRNKMLFSHFFASLIILITFPPLSLRTRNVFCSAVWTQPRGWCWPKVMLIKHLFNK